MTPSIPELLDAYRATAIAWDVMNNDSSKASPLLGELHSIYKQLRANAEGRGGTKELLGDDNVAVRLMAATHSLAWSPEEALTILEAIERDEQGTI